MRIIECIEDVSEAATPEDLACLGEAVGGSAGVAVCGPCSSTLDVAWHLIVRGELGPWDSVIAPRQWAGRGQLRRTWVSEPGNVFGALAWPKEDKDWAEVAPLVAGYLAAEYLGGRGVAAWLKWPNDIVVLGPDGPGKAGGILVEERGGRVVVGIGLNRVTVPDPGLLRRDRAMGAARLTDCGIGDLPLALWVRLVNSMRAGYELLHTGGGPAEAMRRVQARLAWLGEEISVTEGAGETYRARIAGLAPDGGLVLFTAGGAARTIHGGQISKAEESTSGEAS